MRKEEKYYALKEKYQALQQQSEQIFKEQAFILEELKEVCPHDETSAPFLDQVYTFNEMKVCKVCKKSLYFQENEQTWR